MDLNKIEYIFLDMDGTLLDKFYDDHFWEEIVPSVYSTKFNIGIEEAKDYLMNLYKMEEGTLNWTDIKFWSERLGIDIFSLKESTSHLIKLFPDTIDFLEYINSIGKKVFLITNAHPLTLKIKLEKTEIAKYFQKIITAFDTGKPKEDINFWIKLESIISFHKDKSILIDDNENVLITAKNYGINYLYLKGIPNSAKGKNPSTLFPLIEDFSSFLKKASFP